MNINLLNEVVMEIKNEAGQVFRAQFPNGISLQECFNALKTFADRIIAMAQENEQKASASASVDAQDTPAGQSDGAESPADQPVQADESATA
jgi:hypothetical protein